MTMTIEKSAPSSDQLANAPKKPGDLSKKQALREELGKFLKEARLALQPTPTQQEISDKLGLRYSALSAFENGTRNIPHAVLLELAKHLHLDVDLEHGPLAPFASVILSDEERKANKGSRIETALIERVSTLRKERNLTIREMARIVGMNYTQYHRIEQQRGNFTVDQLRLISHRLHINYEYLIDGTHKQDTQQSLRERIRQLERENELLESFRKSVEKQR